MAAKKKADAVVERAEAVLRMSSYGIEEPTLEMVVRASDTIRGPRYGHAVGLRAAGQIEVALAEANDTGWLVNPPAWGDEQRLAEGWRLRFSIGLEGCRGAKPDVAMAALDTVAKTLAGQGGRR